MRASSEDAIAERVARVRERMTAACARAGRAEDAAALIAVSKMQPAEAIVAAARAGVGDFGENYVQEALPKMARVRAILGAEAAGLRFHLVGHLQRNKARAVAGAFAILHAVDSARLIEALAAAGTTAPMDVMLQVNLSGESSKSGVSPAQLRALAAAARAAGPAVHALGLMTIPAASVAAARPVFRELRRLAEEHGLEGLSMGMSDDFEVAIEEGATHVRVGRAIFGERAG
jgi:pyridoxal phosphate enzyme (YggS family)